MRSCIELARLLAARKGIAWEMELTQAEKLLLARRVLRQQAQIADLQRKLKVALHRWEDAEDNAAQQGQAYERRIEVLSAQLAVAEKGDG